MVTLLVLLTVLAMFLLVLSASKTGGVPESISATYYDLGKHGWLFQLFMLFLSAGLFVVWMPVSSDNHQCLVFLACASLLFVAAAPCFREDLQGKVHYTSAIICCVCAVLWQILEGLWDVTLWFAWIGGMLSLMMKDKWCWWMECAVIGSLLANLWRVA